MLREQKKDLPLPETKPLRSDRSLKEIRERAISEAEGIHANILNMKDVPVLTTRGGCIR